MSCEDHIHTYIVTPSIPCSVVFGIRRKPHPSLTKYPVLYLEVFENLTDDSTVHVAAYLRDGEIYFINLDRFDSTEPLSRPIVLGLETIQQPTSDEEWFKRLQDRYRHYKQTRKETLLVSEDILNRLK